MGRFEKISLEKYTWSIGTTSFRVENLRGLIPQQLDLLNELNGIERVFYLCQTFVLMMGNGGIETYYKEPSGNYANETVEALLEMNAKRTALILDRGNGIFHEGIVPENQQLRMEELKNLDYSEISWLFDLLDQEFLQLKEDLEMLSLNYVLNHKEAFM